MTAISHSGASTSPPQPSPTPSAGGSLGYIVNFALFYAGWFACVYALAWRLPWLGPLGALVAIGTHLFMRRNLEASRVRKTALSIAAVMAIGPTIEGSLAWLGVVTFPEPLWLPALTLMSLWGVFATTFDGALGWLEPRPLLAIAFGALGAPPTYFAAAKMGALSLHPMLWKWLAPMAVLWGLGFPALMYLASRIRATAAVELQPAVDR